MKWSYCYHFLHVATIWDSAKQMGFNRFLITFMGIALICLAVYLPTRDLAVEIDWKDSLGLGVLAGCSMFFMPKSIRYQVNHPFFISSAPPSFRGDQKGVEGPDLGAKQFDLKIGDRPHIIFLFLESFGAKHIGAESTPHFHRLIQEGIYFPHFYSNGTLTYRALLSGLFGTPPGNTAVGLSPYVNYPFRGIPELLKSRGYKTAFQHNGSLKFDKQASFLKKHFDEIAGEEVLAQHSSSWGVPDEYLMEYAAKWLQNQSQSTFLALFTITNHHPWIVPNHYQAPDGSRFSQTLHYSDYALGCLIEHLKAMNLSKKTLLFVVGDHGQPLGEHEGNFYNSRFLYEENVRVPLLIWGEGRIETPQQIEQIGSQMDLLPTIAELFSVPCQGEGTSLLRDCKRKMVFLQNPYSEGFVACRWGRWKWIENRLSSAQELYDLANDPGETDNLAAQMPQMCQQLQAEAYSYAERIDSRYKTISFCPAPSYCLDLSNSLITDQQLKGLAGDHLYRVNLENCLLLTSQGIASFLADCPYLEELNLRGLTDICDRVFAKVYDSLKTLDVSDAVDISSEVIAQFCPNLNHLCLNGTCAKQLKLTQLIRFKLFDADAISDEILLNFIENNPKLSRLVIYGCSQLTDRFLSALKILPLEMLWLFNAPQISKAAISALPPIRSLHITSFERVF